MYSNVAECKQCHERFAYTPVSKNVHICKGHLCEAGRELLSSRVGRKGYSYWFEVGGALCIFQVLTLAIKYFLRDILLGPE